MWSEQQPFEGPHAALEPIIRRYRESLVRDAATLGERDANLALDHQTPTPTPGESELFASYNTGLAEVEDALRNWREESMAYRSHAEQLLAAHGRGESLPRPPRRFRQRVWPWEWAGLVLVLAAEIWALVDPIAALFNLEEGSTKPVLFAFVVVLAAGGLAELHAWSRQRAEEAGTTAQRRRALIAAWLALLPVVAMGCIAVTARVYMVQLGEVGNVDGTAAIGEEAVPLMAFAAFQVVVSGAAIGLPRLFHRRLREAQRRAISNWCNELRADLDRIDTLRGQFESHFGEGRAQLRAALFAALACYRSQLASLHPDIGARVEWANRNARELGEFEGLEQDANPLVFPTGSEPSGTWRWSEQDEGFRPPIGGRNPANLRGE